MVVRVEPAGIVIDVGPSETLMAAAVRAGYRWPSICGGLADCGICVMEVVEAPGEQSEPASELEALRLATVPERLLYPQATLRLACQFRPGGSDAVVHKRGVRPAT